MSNVWRELRRQGLLEWLIDPGPSIPGEVRERLAAQLLSSPGAVVMGALNGLIMSAVAFFLCSDKLFVLLGVAEVICCVLRLAVILAIQTACRAGAPAPVRRAALMSIIWCSLQGLIAFFSLRSNVPTLQILSSIMIMGVIGPICARNYPAPRLAILLVCLCDFPFVAGAVLSGNSWLLIVVFMTPPFIFGVSQVIFSFHTMAVGSLIGEFASRHLARHDSLTGLLNRYGLGEALREVSLDREDAALLCLDMDGFKRVNDDFGHHAGDNLLKAVAARLEDGVRAGNAVVRTGGDEFIVFAKGMSPLEAAAFAQRLIGLVMSEPYRLDGFPLIWVGVSVGFACSPHDATDADDLHRKADAALYLAKAAGKGVSRPFIHDEAQRELRAGVSPRPDETFVWRTKIPGSR